MNVENNQSFSEKIFWPGGASQKWHNINDIPPSPPPSSVEYMRCHRYQVTELTDELNDACEIEGP